MEGIVAQQFPATPQTRSWREKYRYDEYMVSRFAQFVPDLEKFLASMEERPPVYIRVNTLKIGQNALIQRLKDKGFSVKSNAISRTVSRSPPSPIRSARRPSTCWATSTSRISRPWSRRWRLRRSPATWSSTWRLRRAERRPTSPRLVNNEGLIVAIEKDPLRMPGLRANLGRCGVRNTALFDMDAREVGRLDIKGG